MSLVEGMPFITYVSVSDDQTSVLVEIADLDIHILGPVQQQEGLAIARELRSIHPGA
jgi:hypothetical protein